MQERGSAWPRIHDRHALVGQDQGVSWSDSALDARIEDVIVDAYGDAAQLGSFACVLDELLDVPVNATVMGRAGLTAWHRRWWPTSRASRHGERSTGTWAVAVVDIAVESASSPELALTLAAYRRWLGDGSA